MDPNAITTIVGSAVSLLIPFLKKMAEGTASETGKKLAGAACDKVRQLYETIKAKSEAKPEAVAILAELKRSPDDTDAQAALRFHLRSVLSQDEAAAKEIAELLREASHAGVDNVFNTTINGNVQKLVQMGVVYGDVRI